ncbi:MAG: carbon-nitrogen hydrolase family protein [Thermoplasmata archaeon]
MRFLGVQFKISGEDFRDGFPDHVERFFKESSPGDVVVFPEDIGLLTAFSGIQGKSMSEAIQSLYSRNQERIEAAVREYQIGNMISAIFLSLTDKFVVDFYDLFSALSRKYAVYTITCNNMARFTRREGELKAVSGGIYNTAFVFDPKGNLVFKQDKVFLTQMEKDLGISSGDISTVSTFSINGREIGIAISLDAFTPAYISRLERSEIMVQPDANPVKWNSFLSNGRWQPEEWMDSAYYIAQRMESVKFVINPMMVGDLLDVRFEGQSSITKKAETSDTKMSYIGNLPSTGFHSILRVGNYSPETFVDRGEIVNKELTSDEGMVQIEV